MTCKKCLHHKMCVKEYMRERLTPKGYELTCRNFKNKADFVEVKHGEWIYHQDDLFPAESMQECSVCHEEELFTICNDNFCPNCGAKMDKEREHESD